MKLDGQTRDAVYQPVIRILSPLGRNGPTVETHPGRNGPGGDTHVAKV